MESSPAPSDRTRHCKVCSGRARHLYATPNDYGGVRELEHYRCAECGLVFIGNHLTLEQIRRAYEELDARGMLHQTPEENEIKFRVAIDALRERIAPEGKALDIGAGRGEFAQLLLEAGYGNVAVHEIPGRDLAHLGTRGIAIFQDFDYRSLPDETYDFVSLLDVAEHALYPVGLLRACHRVLKPGGTLYIHVPTVTRVDRIMQLMRGVPLASSFGRKWQAGRTSIFHLQIFTRKALEIALRRAGFVQFTIEQCNQLAFPADHYVKSYLCEKQGIPHMFAPLVTPIVRPLLATNFFNANRGFARAEKIRSAARNEACPLSRAGAG